jgi:hypothetical protein
MLDFQQRVVDEKTELDSKIDKLKAFIVNNPVYKTLPPDEQALLNQQYDCMVEYAMILGQRIQKFV